MRWVRWACLVAVATCLLVRMLPPAATSAAWALRFGMGRADGCATWRLWMVEVEGGDGMAPQGAWMDAHGRECGDGRAHGRAGGTGMGALLLAIAARRAEPPRIVTWPSLFSDCMTMAHMPFACF